MKTSHLLNVVLNFLDGVFVSDRRADIRRRFDKQEEEKEEEEEGSCFPIKAQSQRLRARLGEIIDY